MKKWSLVTTVFLATMVVLILSLLARATAGKASPSFQPNPEAEEIKKVIKESYWITGQAARDFDTSQFESVFVNDSRGGKLDPAYVDLIDSVNRQTGTSFTYGFLDYKLAYYTWWETGALKIEALRAKAGAEIRDLTSEESASLMDDSGRLAAPRSQGEVQEPDLKFISIEVNGDTAEVVFNDLSRQNRMILVKIDEQWFIAGNKIIAVFV